ncbi:MAG: hypothetical protein ACRD4Q_16435 [Candidatus Acidiferrales bacterium]
MTTSVYRRILYAPIAAFVLGWALCASVARGSPVRNAATYPAALQAESVDLPAESYTWDFQAEASELLGEIQGLAGKLHNDADLLQSHARRNLSRESQAAQLTLMREHVNAMGTRLTRLQEIKHVTAPWQQQAINRIHPFAVEVAANTEAAISHMNENGSYLFAPSYREHVATAVDQAAELKNNVGDFLAYANAQQQLNRLQTVIEAD